MNLTRLNRLFVLLNLQDQLINSILEIYTSRQILNRLFLCMKKYNLIEMIILAIFLSFFSYYSILSMS
jgi:hypothetical protein